MPNGKRTFAIMVGGETLNLTRSYTVAVNGMLADGGHSQTTFLAGRNKRDAGKLFETVKKYFAEQKEVGVPADERIIKKKP